MAGQIIPMAAAAASGLIQDIWQNKLNRDAEKRQLRGSKELMDYQQKKALEMWERTGYGPQMEQMKKAGLNPALMYGMSGGGAQTTGGVGATAGMAITESKMGMGLQNAILAAQIRNIEANTENTEADTEKKKGPDTENVKADTELKILQAIVTQYTGKEAKDVYENVTSPNRGIQAKTYQDELEARQGVAGTIYQMWLEGKLEEKSLAEIEQIVLANAKSRAERIKIMKEIDILEENLKGQKMENVMKDLEMRLQKETGIDRNSPAWMKVIGRLFVELLNR